MHDDADRVEVLEAVLPADGAAACSAARSQAHAALARVLPVLARYGSALVPEHRTGRVGVSGEDLVQSAALAALDCLEKELGSSGLPSWWREDELLLAYLRGIMWRRLKRVLRARREVAADLALELAAQGAEPDSPVRCRERARVRACLGGVRSLDLRLYARYGRGRSYAELAARAGVSPDALAKRRGRFLAELRRRCRGCPLRREQGCAWIPRGWI